jgi:hypothetical protein
MRIPTCSSTTSMLMMIIQALQCLGQKGQSLWKESQREVLDLGKSSENAKFNRLHCSNILISSCRMPQINNHRSCKLTIALKVQHLTLSLITKIAVIVTTLGMSIQLEVSIFQKWMLIVTMEGILTSDLRITSIVVNSSIWLMTIPLLSKLF